MKSEPAPSADATTCPSGPTPAPRDLAAGFNNPFWKALATPNKRFHDRRELAARSHNISDLVSRTV